MASTAPSNQRLSASFVQHASRAIETRGVIDVWLLGITTVFCGQYFGWNLGLTAGFSAMITSTIVMGMAYVCFTCCVSEVTGALPFAGGSYGLARCTLGFFPGFLIGCCEAINYIGSVATTMIAMAAMVVLIVPTWAGYEPVVMLVLYASVIFIHLVGSKSFWVGNFLLGLTSVGIWFAFICSNVGSIDFQANTLGDNSQGFVGGMPEFFRVFPFSAWFYIGVEGLNLASDDLLHPESAIPRAQVSLTVAFVFMSLTTVFVAVSLPHPDQQIIDLAMNPTPLNPGFILGLGLSDSTATALGIPATYGMIYGASWSYTKLLHAMASSKLLPPVLATTYARDGTPYMAMIAGSLVSYTVCVVVFYKAEWAPYALSVSLLFSFMSYIGQCIG